MISTASNSTFLIPISTPLSGDTVEFGIAGKGSNFVADQNNLALRYLCQPDQILPSDWPMVLFGVHGSGKTSLALSLVSYFVERTGQKASVFTAEGFRRKYANSLETDSIHEFRQSISDSSILFLDDVQRLKNYSAAQAELANLIDFLASVDTPVVFTISDAEMKSPEIVPRLFSRLSGGLCLPGKFTRYRCSKIAVYRSGKFLWFGMRSRYSGIFGRHFCRPLIQKFIPSLVCLKFGDPVRNWNPIRRFGWPRSLISFRMLTVPVSKILIRSLNGLAKHSN